MPMVTVTMIPGPEFKRCAAALLTVDGRIHPKHTEEIQEKEPTLLSMVRSNVMATPARTGQHTGLRADIAAATHAAGIGDGSRYWNDLGGSRANIPRYLDTGPGWMHPVFGRSPWVFQQGGYNWFTKPLESKGQMISSDLDQVNDSEAAYVAGQA